MNQANQQLLVQSTNIDLVGIRYLELSYFASFFSNFGTIDAIYCGMIIGSLSQVPGLHNPTFCPYFFVVMYWVGSCITLAAGIYGLVTTLIVQVFAQGYALRGPPGSMVHAIEGMLIEQRNTVLSFNIATYAFGFQCIGMWFIMFDFTSACICGSFTFLAMIYWYAYSLRLYNRFAMYDNPWEEKGGGDDGIGGRGGGSKISWRGGRNKEEDLQREKEEEERKDYHMDANNAKQQQKKVKKKQPATEPSLREHFLGTKSADNNSSPSSPLSSSSYIPPSFSKEDDTDASHKEEQDNGGYLTVKLPKASSSSSSSSSTTAFSANEPWQRCYFLLQRRQFLSYYSNQRAYQLEPSKPLHTRPIDLDGYQLILSSSSRGGGPYLFAIQPKNLVDDHRRTWTFRCDTLGEYEGWLRKFEKSRVEMPVAISTAGGGAAKATIQEMKGGVGEHVTDHDL